MSLSVLPFLIPIIATSALSQFASFYVRYRVLLLFTWYNIYIYIYVYIYIHLYIHIYFGAIFISVNGYSYGTLYFLPISSIANFSSKKHSVALSWYVIFGKHIMKYIRESKGYPFIPHKSIQNFKIVLLYIGLKYSISTI